MNMTERIIEIILQFRIGSEFTVNDVKQHFETLGETISKRTVQRDLKFLSNKDILTEKMRDDTRHRIYRLNFFGTEHLPRVMIPETDKLSIHLLKAYLPHFKGTLIEEGINTLLKAIDKVAPGQVFDSNSFFWDKNFGRYKYFQSDPIIRRLIKYMSESKWVKISYKNNYTKKINTFPVYPRTLFQFNGSLYLVVLISGSANEHRVLLIQNIENIEETSALEDKIQELDFEEWSKNRFGVFWGELIKVKLKIGKDHVQHFENRNWHQTQKDRYDKEGNLLITMEVPLAPELEAWIASWGNIIEVIEPINLINRIKRKHLDALKVYE